MTPEERALAIVDLVELTGLNAEEYLSVKTAIVSAIQAAEEPIKKDRDNWFSRCRAAQQANEFAETRIRELERRTALSHKIIICLVSGEIESARRLLVEYQNPIGAK